MILINTAEIIKKEIAQRVKRCRLDINLSQQGLADRSGVNIATLRVFERQGKISLENLLKLASALGELDGFENLFVKSPDEISGLDEILAEPKQRQRGRIK